MSDADELREIAARVRTQLEVRGRSGLQGVSRKASRRMGVAAIEAPIAHADAHADAHAHEGSTAGENAAPVGARGLTLVREEIGDCRRCRLSGGRQNIVFGVGSPQAHLVFVGEAPGADEDQQGEPFVGKAGQLLTKMIEAMGYRREDVYICNVIKCRPPGNRNPEPDEGRGLRAVLEEAARGAAAAHDRDAGQVRGAVPAARRDADLTPARQLPHLRGHQLDADLSPRVPAARSEQEERGLDRPQGSERGVEAARIRAAPHARPVVLSPS